MLIYLTAASMAANPAFEGNHTVVELADTLWEAAEACAGRAPEFPEPITLTRQRDPREELRVVPVYEDGELRAFDMVRDTDPFFLASALATTWFEGPPPLRHALAEPLAECVARLTKVDMMATRPEANRLDTAPDLLEWTDDTALTGTQQGAGLVAARRLGLLLDATLPEGVIKTQGLDSWDAVMSALEGVDGGEAIVTMLRGGAEAQHEGLADPDQDGLLTLQEMRGGTDPERWDTDGDGWWDGYDERPDGAIPVSPDGTPTCLPMVARRGDTSVELGGQMRGVDIGSVDVAPFLRDDLWRNPGELASGRGGHWIRAVGDNLMPNRFCAWTPEATLRVVRLKDDDEPDLDDQTFRDQSRVKELEGVTVEQLQAFAARVSEVVRQYRETLGHADFRMHVDLGVGNGIEFRGGRAPTVSIATPQARKVLRSEKLGENAAHLAVSLQRLGGLSAGAEHPATALLYAESNLDRKIPRGLLPVYAKDVRVVRAQFDKECEDGWMDVFDVYCLERIYEDLDE